MDNKGAYLFGTGGSGMTYLKRKFNFINKEPESWQHFRYFNSSSMGVRLDIPKDVKIVYLFAHPFDTLLSFERRGFLKDYGLAVSNLQGDVEGYELFDVSNLKEYVKTKMDFFMFGNHFHRFYNLPNNVLFIKYEALKDNIDFISDWAGVPVVSEEPFSERSSDFTKCDCNTLKGLIEIHGGWADHYNKLPDSFTNKDKKTEYDFKKRKDYLFI